MSNTLIRLLIVSISMLVVSLPVWLYLTPAGSEFLDRRRFAALDRRCQSAREIVYRRVETEVIDIEDHPWATVVNETYAPYFMVVKLLAEPKVVKTINMRFEDNVSIDRGCQGAFVSIVHDMNSMPKAIPCGQRLHSAEVPISPVLVRLEHGPIEGDIRPLKLLIVDTKTQEIIAEQVMHELFLGHLRSRATLIKFQSAQGRPSALKAT